jgi:hypothetical protein
VLLLHVKREGEGVPSCQDRDLQRGTGYQVTEETTTAPGDAQRLRCFVIGPIGNRHATHGSEERVTYEEALQVWEEVIQPACAVVGLSPVRADGLSRAGEIPDQVFRRLRHDDVVIADLTGANANVMYELGLRHTQASFTVQIGEYGRLPFDVNVIRTVLFSRSPRALINARDELIDILRTGLAGEFDPVSATRVWNEDQTVEPDAESIEGLARQEADDAPGFVDLVVRGEELQPQLNEVTNAINDDIVELGALAENASEEMGRSDAAGSGMKGRLAVIARFAHSMDEIAGRLEEHVARYEETMGAVSSGFLALIGRLEEDPSQLPEAMDFSLQTRRLASIGRESMAQIGGMAGSIQENAKLSRILRGPSNRTTDALSRFETATQVMDEWDRRLQALGVPVPAADWQPDADEAVGTEAAEAVDAGDASEEGSH